MLFAPHSFPDGPRLDTKKALLLIDFQNDFVVPTGKLYADNVQTFLPKLSELVACFREKGEIVWTSTEYREPCPTISPETGSFTILLKQFLKILDEQNSSECLTPLEDDASCCRSEDTDPPVEFDQEAFLSDNLPEGTSRCCEPNTHGAEIIEYLKESIDRRRDIVVRRHTYSAFADMSLVFQLRTRMVVDLYICGSLSNISVYATVLDAVRHGFNVTVIEDCLGYRDRSCHISAMRQMADNMCAEGTDYQELMDDLAGLLGDVIKEETFTTRLQVDLSRSTRRETSNPRSWRPGARPDVLHASPQHSGEHSRIRSGVENALLESPIARHESLGVQGTRTRSSTLESSPPRKRSTDDIDDDLEDYQSAKASPLSAYRRQSYEIHPRTTSRENKSKIRVRRKNPPESPRRVRSSVPTQSRSINLESDPASPSSSVTNNHIGANMSTETSNHRHVSKKLAKKKSQAVLGPGDHIGDGTSSIIYNVLDDERAKSAFDTLRAEVRWQKMYHRTGEVPRLVAVQGDMMTSPDGTKTYPVYRHPSDESPELLPFDATVDALRRECESRVGHPLNHVLIQHYRNSEDNISEHSDKTLDIVRDSLIVNLSLGAQRTMTLRTKRVDAVNIDQGADTSVPTTSSVTSLGTRLRISQRIPLPNASLFILSTSTNAKYLHAIRADKRPLVEKTEAELAFNCERISLTFRHIGTFITETVNVHQRRIWGQGATAKTQPEAKNVLQPTNNQVKAKEAASNEPQDGGDINTATNTTTKDDTIGTTKVQLQQQQYQTEADTQAEAMIIGFGRENQENDSFDWDGVYGGGFDVVNFITKPVKGTEVEVDDVVPSTIAVDNSNGSIENGIRTEKSDTNTTPDESQETVTKPNHEINGKPADLTSTTTRSVIIDKQVDSNSKAITNTIANTNTIPPVDESIK